MIRVLLTSFEPFGGFGLNSSFVVGQAAASRPLAGVELDWLVLPVVAWDCLERAWARVRQTRPAVVLALGQQAGAPCLRIEEVAANLNDFRIPDNAGNLLKKQPIFPGGPACYRTTSRPEELAAALARGSIPVERSLSAGTYVCNHLYYGLLHEAALARAAHQTVFLHLPLLAVQVPARARTPARDLEELVEGVRRVVGACVVPATPAAPRELI
jgi:pyroglutamyl-peptidase